MFEGNCSLAAVVDKTHAISTSVSRLSNHSNIKIDQSLASSGSVMVFDQFVIDLSKGGLI
jgi:hypothetical protein